MKSLHQPQTCLPLVWLGAAWCWPAISASDSPLPFESPDKLLDLREPDVEASAVSEASEGVCLAAGSKAGSLESCASGD